MYNMELLREANAVVLSQILVVSIQHVVTVVDVPPLLLDLLFPPVLRVSHPVDDRGPVGPHRGRVGGVAGGAAATPGRIVGVLGLLVLELVVLLAIVGAREPLVEDWVEAGEEAHVDDENADDPDDEDDHHLHDAEIPYLVEAFASRAESVGLCIVEVQLGQDDVLTVAGLRGHGGVDIDRPPRLGREDDVVLTFASPRVRSHEGLLSEVLDQFDVGTLAHASRVLVGALVGPLKVIQRPSILTTAIVDHEKDEQNDPS